MVALMADEATLLSKADVVTVAGNILQGMFVATFEGSVVSVELNCG